MSGSIAELLVARAHDTNVGLRFEDASWTWAEVVAASAVRAAVLDQLRGEGPFHVGVLLDNVPEYVFLLGGAALAGATIVGINPTRRGDALAADIRHTDCQLVLTDRVHAPLLHGLDLGVAPERVVEIDVPEWHARLEAHAGAMLPNSLPGPDTLFVLVFTSGSSGAPKAVRGTQGRFAGFGAGMPFTADDVLYCPMPLFHGNALASCVVPALATGATLAIRARFSASELLADLRRFDATFFSTVGRALSYVLATPPTPHDRDHRVKFALGPESSAADVRAFRERFGIAIVQGYGQSEGAIVLAPTRGAQRGALGVAAPEHDIVVVDPDSGVECPRAEFDEHGRLINATAAIGEIVRRDPNVRFEGYYRNDAAAADRMRNGWYWSGDLAYRDADGVFYFAGRHTDWIRVDAENFAAAPVERILGRHPDVAAVAVYGVADPVTGDQVMAALELRPGATFDPTRFERFLAEQRDLGTKWAPTFVRIVERLPTTGPDKVDRKPLRAEAWATSDPVWWKPARDADYRLLTDADRAALRARFAEHGRADFAP